MKFVQRTCVSIHHLYKILIIWWWHLCQKLSNCVMITFQLVSWKSINVYHLSINYKITLVVKYILSITTVTTIIFLPSLYTRYPKRHAKSWNPEENRWKLCSNLSTCCELFPKIYFWFKEKRFSYEYIWFCWCQGCCVTVRTPCIL